MFSDCFVVASGSDAILLGAETLRGLYPVETISIVGKICAEVSYPFNWNSEVDYLHGNVI